jgi:Zn-dependent M16 (insulinase) family peptidase
LSKQNEMDIDCTYCIQIIGEPSIEEQERLAKEENERVEKQRERLGKDGLQKKATTLEKATEENEVIVLFSPLPN